jgi:hypothetical protein
MSGQPTNRPPRKVLLQEFEDGMTLEEIGRKHHSATGTVEKWFAHYGISRKAMNTDKSDDVNVGNATVVAIDTNDDGVTTFAVPGGKGTVVGISEAKRIGAIMNGLMGGA